MLHRMVDLYSQIGKMGGVSLKRKGVQSNLCSEQSCREKVIKVWGGEGRVNFTWKHKKVFMGMRNG